MAKKQSTKNQPSTQPKTWKQPTSSEDQEQPVQMDMGAWLADYSAAKREQDINAREAEIEGESDWRYLPTGLKSIDRALGGGILSPGLTVLGAAPGIGKTTLSIQIALHVARTQPRRTVLFFSLEMAAQALIPKIRACNKHTVRIDSFASSDSDFSVDASAADASTSSGDAETVQAATLSASPDRLPDNFYIIDDRTPRLSNDYAWTPTAICSVVKQVVATSGEDSAQRPLRPLVIVDYLQFIPPKKEGMEERIRVNEALGEFSGITDRAAMLLISSLNRGAYNSPIQEGAFKETGLIEFSADVLLGMQYSAVNSATPGKNGAITIDRVKEAAKNPREVELVVLKNRYFGVGAQVPLHFYPKENYFVSVEEDVVKKAAEPFYINIAWGIADRLRCPRIEEYDADAGYRIFKGSVQRNKKLSRGNLKPPVEIQFEVQQPIDSPIDGFDMVVADAIYTLYHRDGKGFNARSIQRLITGGRQSYSKRVKKIQESIEKLRESSISIDCREWAAKDDSFSKPQELINELAGEPSAEGSVKRKLPFLDVSDPDKGYYRFKNTHPMALYLYAEWTGRFVEAPSGLLGMGSQAGEGKGAFSYTPGNVVMMQYLIEEIELIGSPTNKRTKPQITLFKMEDGQPRGAYARAGARNADDAKRLWAKEKRSNGSKPITNILDWFCDEGYITGYEWGAEDADALIVTVKGNI